MPAQFKVVGPISIPFTLKKSGCKWIAQYCSEFWKPPSASKYASRKGCYVFAMRSGGGITPYYVGKSTKGFRRECLTLHKINHFNGVLADGKKGKPVMFFVVLQQAMGPTNNKAIRKLEDFLIQTAVAKNPDLENVQGVKGEDWGIEGILRGGTGKPSRSARALKQSLGL